MRVLWLTPYPLTSPMHGGKIRARNLLIQTTERGHRCSVWAVSDEEWGAAEDLGEVEVRRLPPRRRVSAGEKLRAALDPLPEEAWRAATAEVREALRLAAPDFDVAVFVQAHLGAYAPLLDEVRIPWVLDTQNVESWLTRQLAGRAARRVTRLRLGRDADKYRAFERHLFAAAPLVVAVSEADRDRILRDAPAATVEVHPSGVDLAYFAWTDHSEPRGASLLMTGTLGYPPNLDAALWMHDEVLPAIRRRIPDAVLTLVGQAAPAQLSGLHRPEAGFRVVGSVPDVRPYLAEADVFVIPLRAGSGTRLKALEALASGVPLVATPLGVEGLGLEERGLALTASDADGLAEAVVAALRDRQLRSRLTTEGRRHVEAEHDWRQIGERFVASLARVAAR